MKNIALDYLKYMESIEKQIGVQIPGTSQNFADGIIEEPWFDTVIREINKISADIANDVENQTGMRVKKNSHYLHLHEAPFHRLLWMEIALSAWLGWILNEKQRDKNNDFSAPHFFERIRHAFEFGEDISDQYPGLSIQQIISKIKSQKEQHEQ